jgi:hypothetical protein
MILRLYPRPFRDRWGEEIVLLFAELARRRPTAALWSAAAPDLARGLLGEWWRELGPARHPAVAHGVLAGTLLSAATVAGNLGDLWATPFGRIGSWFIGAAALTVLALTGRSSAAGPRALLRALRNGSVGGLIAFTSANLTATVIVLAGLDRLRHDPVQLAAFAASHEPDFRAYQIHELLGGWAYGSVAGALLGALTSAATLGARRFVRERG